MFEDLKYTVKESNLPENIKVVLLAFLKATSWFPWVFVGVGLILNKEYFIYWLIFFMTIYGTLMLALIYSLLQILKSELNIKSKVVRPKIVRPFLQTVKEGIVGNIAYAILIGIFALLKLTGWLG